MDIEIAQPPLWKLVIEDDWGGIAEFVFNLN